MPTTPTQIRIPPGLLVQIDSAAKAEGLTRTAWLLRAAKASLAPATLVEEARPTDSPPPGQKPYACPVCHRRFVNQVRCPCSNRLAVPA